MRPNTNTTIMDQPTTPGAVHRGTLPTSKEKNAVQREVNRLLDELAPERATTRGDRAPAVVQQHRTPNGCILQAPNAAVSVSWYADAADDSRLGELQIVQWRGVVSRRGSSAKHEAATVVRQQVLHPVERPADACVWHSDDGIDYDTSSLVAHCLELLSSQMTGPVPET
jgi:hypothetical protein